MAILLTQEQKEKLIGLSYQKSSAIEELEKYSTLFKDNISVLARLVRIKGIILKYATDELKDNLELYNRLPNKEDKHKKLKI